MRVSMEGRRMRLQANDTGQRCQAGHGAWWPCGGRALLPVGHCSRSEFLIQLPNVPTDSANSPNHNFQTVKIQAPVQLTKWEIYMRATTLPIGA